MNQPPKNNLSTIDAVIDDIIAEMPLDDRVKTANLDEDGLAVLQLALGKYLKHFLKLQSEEANKELFKDCIKQSGHLSLNRSEAASYILRRLWERLRDTHRLRVVK